jgi:hypothetical protein
MTGRGWRLRHAVWEIGSNGDSAVHVAVAGFRAGQCGCRAGGRANRVALQLGVPIAELAGYGARKQTRIEHLRTIGARLGWRTAEWKDLEEFVLARAVEHDAPSVLFRLGCEYLQAAKIVRPEMISPIWTYGSPDNQTYNTLLL